MGEELLDATPDALHSQSADTAGTFHSSACRSFSVLGDVELHIKTEAFEVSILVSSTCLVSVCTIARDLDVEAYLSESRLLRREVKSIPLKAVVQTVIPLKPAILSAVK
jgi:hypothetical protein